jgi:nitrogen fixation protein FixH
MYFELHCCGKSEELAQAMVEMGVDSWSGQVMNDKYQLREDFGDKMAIGIQFFPQTEEEMKNLADDMFEKISKDYVQKPMYLQNVRPNEPLRRYVYERSRILFSK